MTVAGNYGYKNARVVRSGWLQEGGRRLDCTPYMSGALEARDALKRLSARKERLADVTERIFHAGREKRTWVDDPRYGVPFLGSTDILTADLSHLSLLAKSLVKRNPLFTLDAAWTLITRSGTVGRMAYVRPDMAGMACSEDVLRVVPNAAHIPPGYLYAFLSSRYGVPLVVSGTYGAIIQHIEPEHIVGLPVPRFGADFERKIHSLIDKSAALLSRYQTEIAAATDDLFNAVGLTDISPTEWHHIGTETGFSVPSPDVTTLRALNFNPRFRRLWSSINSVPHRRLGDICVPGTLMRGDRFKRIDASKEYALRMVGQREMFWLRPEGRFVAKSSLPDDAVLPHGSIIVAARGTLGENELYSRAEFVIGPWEQFAFSEDILRIIAEKDLMPRGCLYAFMRSETAFRMLRSISTGSKLQDHHYRLRNELPIPYPPSDVQHAIHNKVVAAYEARHQAVAMIDNAVQQVECHISDEEN